MTLYKTFIVALACLAVSACTTTATAPTTAAQQRYNSMDMTLRSINDQAVSCLDTVSTAHPESEKTFSQDNNHRIERTDKPTISTVLTAFISCRTRAYEQLEKHPDYLVRSFAPISKESLELRGAVYRKYLNGEITGKEAASSLDNIGNYLGAKWDANEQQIVNGLNQQHFQELQVKTAAQTAMLQALSGGFQDYSRQQQIFNQQRQANQVPRAVHTSCQWNGGIMNCTSF